MSERERIETVSVQVFRIGAYPRPLASYHPDPDRFVAVTLPRAETRVKHRYRHGPPLALLNAKGEVDLGLPIEYAVKLRDALTEAIREAKEVGEV